MYWLRTFGGFAIERDGAPLDEIGAHRKGLGLLAVLAVEGSMGRDRLMALLWSESDTERAKGSLKQAVYMLRRQLDIPNLLLGTTELRLNPEHIQSDVHLFSRAMEEGDLATAVRHYTGPFLDGVYLERTPEFERWVEAQRLDLAQQYARALEGLARAAEAQGDHAAAAGWWRRLQGADPLNSRVAVSLMTALDTSGDRAAALQHAQIHETLLREELGIAPDPAVATLAERLRSPSAPPQQKAPTVPDLDSTARVGEFESRGGGMPVQRSAPASGVLQHSWTRRPLLLMLVALLGLGVVIAVLLGTRNRIFFYSAQAPVPVPESRSIAVLPFLDMSPQGDQEYFSDGMAEELISHLSKVEGLQVAARTSAFQFKGRNPDIREVGAKLGVATVLEGSVRRSGDRLRITAQLVDAQSGYHLWTQSYERQMSDVFAIQDEISRAIVEALQVRLAAGAAAPLVAPPTQDIEAYEQYLKGLLFFNRHQIPRAIEHLGEATRRDPQFARAYAALAEAYTVRYSDRPPPENHARGVAAARAALRLDPSLADAHAALGLLEMIDFRWAEAEHSLRRATELDPRAPRARFYYAIYLHRQGRWDDAFAQMARARELDPLSLPINALYGSFLGDLGRVDEAIAHLKATLELDSAFPITQAALGHIYMGTERHDHALRHYQRVAELVPVSMYAGFLGHGYARAGRRDDARRVLEQLQAQIARGEYVSPGAVGWIYLGLGEPDEGFRWLERAAEERDVFLTVYAVLTNRYLSAPYRNDPRFQQLRRKIGLPP